MFNSFEKSMNKIVFSLRDPVLVLNDNKVVIVNSAFKDKISRTKLIKRGMKIETSVPKKLFTLINEMKFLDEVEYSQNRKYFKIKKTKIKNEKDIYTFLIFNNISIEKEEELNRAKFLSDASHELKTPMTSIMGYAELVKKKCSCDSSEYAIIIEEETKRLSKIIDDMLQISKMSDLEHKFEETNLYELIESVVRLKEIEAKNKGVEINFIQKAPLFINIDSDKIKQVFLNILNNDIIYTKSKIDILIREEKRFVYIDIIDDGIGMTKEQSKNIFKRFYRTDESRNRNLGGSGLGMAIVKEIIDLHKGEITVLSELEKGTKIKIKLPKEE